MFISQALHSSRTRDALTVLRLMPGLQLKEGLLMLLIAQLTRLRQWPLIKAHYEHSKRADVPPSLALLNRMLRAAAVFGDRDTFDSLMGEVATHAYTPDIDTHNAKLLFAVKQGTKDDVRQELNAIKAAGLDFNARTYGVLLEQAVLEKDPDEVLRVLHVMRPVPGFEYTSAALLSHALMLLGRPAYLTRLHAVVTSISNAYIRGVPLSLETAIIEALSDAGDSEAALKRFFRVLSNAPSAAADPLYAAAFRVRTTA
jgi:hypothetical protein